MDENKLLEQMAQFLENDTPHLLREQNLSELDLKQAAAKKANDHYNGRWTDEEQEIIDAVCATLSLRFRRRKCSSY
jgi:hypothetical protein